MCVPVCAWGKESCPKQAWSREEAPRYAGVARGMQSGCALEVYEEVVGVENLILHLGCHSEMLEQL